MTHWPSKRQQNPTQLYITTLVLVGLSAKMMGFSFLTVCISHPFPAKCFYGNFFFFQLLGNGKHSTYEIKNIYEMTHLLVVQ